MNNLHQSGAKTSGEIECKTNPPVCILFWHFLNWPHANDIKKGAAATAPSLRNTRSTD